ncbi:MAG TPA: hypothetical protein VHA35_07470 [Dongiaceae bacterium]|nr:hypothetical protein [Dongiaceae bacterium]
MKYVLWGIVGLVVLTAVAGGAVYYWTTHAKVDFSNPQVAGNFKESFNTNCVTRAQKRASQGGVTLSGEQLDRLDQACSCARDGIITALAKRTPMTVVEIADAMRADPELNGIIQACSTKFGIENPL